TDDGENDAGESAPERDRVERSGAAVRPCRAEQVRQQARVQEEAVADHGGHGEQPLPRRARRKRSPGRSRAYRWTHWCSVRVLPGSAARSSMNAATRGSRHERRKFAQISVSVCLRKSPQTKGSALISLTSPFGSTISSAAGCLRRNRSSSSSPAS